MIFLDHWDNFKWQNLGIIGIQGEGVQGKDMENIFTKIITENFQNAEEQIAIQLQEAFSTPNR
jgi:hypothetical protein